jgi:Tripartite tricarboxylate transporter TctB family
MAVLRGKPLLEWAVAGAGVAGGVALMVAGAEYGLSSPTGVAAGTFPAAAGALLTLAGVLWLISLLRHVPIPAHETALEVALETALGDDLTERVADVETRAEGRLELDNHPIPPHHHEVDEVEDPVTAAADRQGMLRVGIVVVAIAVAALLLDVVGFVIVMTVLLVTVLVFTGKQPVWRAVLVGLVAALATRYVFGELLGVSLPTSSIAVLSDWGI